MSEANDVSVYRLVGRCRHIPGDVVYEVEHMEAEYCQCRRCGRELERELGSGGRWRLSRVGLFYPTKANAEICRDSR